MWCSLVPLALVLVTVPDPTGGIRAGLGWGAGGSLILFVLLLQRHRASPKRTKSLQRITRHRSYDRTLVRRLVFIRRGRELGFKLEEIRALLVLAEPGKTSCAAVREIAGPHLCNVREKIVRLQRLEGIPAAAVTRCASAASADCPVLDMLDGGPGAHEVFKAR